MEISLLIGAGLITVTTERIAMVIISGSPSLGAFYGPSSMGGAFQALSH